MTLVDLTFEARDRFVGLPFGCCLGRDKTLDYESVVKWSIVVNCIVMKYYDIAGLPNHQFLSINNL